jgi:hypothetical protein
MGKKIITVDLNFPPTEVVDEEVDEVEDKKDEYTEVKEDATLTVIETPEPPKPSKARKPPTKGKKPVAEPPPGVEVEPLLDAGTQEAEPVIEPVAEPKSEDTQKVKCQHCNKEMTMKSLKYSHSRNCLGLKKTIEKVSNEKVSQKTEDIKPRTVSAPPPTPEPILAAPTLPIKMKAQVEEHPRVVRMKALKEKYNSLVQNAFNV